MTRAPHATEELIRVGREMLRRGLTWGNAGNISCRLGDDAVLITASGASLGELGSDDLVEVPLANEAAAVRGRKPSKEVPLHRAVYRARPDAEVVLHGAPPYSTLAACSGLSVPDGLFVETMYYLERVARVPYHHPGSPELGEAVGAAARSAEVLLLENHGVVVFDTSPAEALQALEVLEFACRLVVQALASGLTLQTLPEAAAEDFRLRSGYRPVRLRPAGDGS